MERVRQAATALVLACCLLAGCAPTVLCVVETEIQPDYTASRVTRMESFPNPRFPGQRPRLADYFQFPPAELYDSYVVQQDKVLLAGLFDSYDQIPSDLVRGTPGTTALAGNLFSYRVMDLVLFVLADFDETLTDIVASQEDGEAALYELVRLAVPEVMSVLRAKYEAKYDLSRLEAWLSNDLPAKLRRIYAGAWAIHSAKRSGVTSPGEEYEYYLFLRAEALREGLELAEYGHPDLGQENLRRLKEYAARLAGSLVVPRGGGVVDGQDLAGIAADELVASIQRAITARHGSVNNYVGKIAALVPRAFGAYLTGTMMPIYLLPETTYQYRLRLPGTVIQSNGVRELNGDLMWTFSDRDLAFTGQSMWARSIFIREPAVYALGLRGFPATLADVDRLFGLCLAPGGTPREGVLQALGQSVAVRSLAPLEALATAAQHPDAVSARGILELFSAHRRAQTSAAGPARGAGAMPPIPEPGPAVQAGVSVGSRPGAAVPGLEPIPVADEPAAAMPVPAGGAAGEGAGNGGPSLSPLGGIEPPPLPPPVR
ncbi:MAG: hypothetical protein LIP77_12070 [Planctomycetes bacterium]|nr:hypothetical protein [Planctomycetota bacterium]